MARTCLFFIVFIFPYVIFAYVGEENWIAIFNGHPYHPPLRHDAHTVDHPFYPARFDEHPKHYGDYLPDAFLAYWLQHNPHYEVFGQTFENEQKQICAKFPASNSFDQMIKCNGFRVLINRRPVYDKNDSDFFLRSLSNPDVNVPEIHVNVPEFRPEIQPQEYIPQPVTLAPKIESLTESVQPRNRSEVGHYYKDELGNWHWHEGVDGSLGHWYRDQNGWHWHSAYGQEYTINYRRRRRHRALLKKSNVLSRLRRQPRQQNPNGEEVEFLNQKAVLIVDPQRQHSFFGTARPIYEGSHELEAIGVNYEGKVIIVPLTEQHTYRGYQVFEIVRF